MQLRCLGLAGSLAALVFACTPGVDPDGGGGSGADETGGSGAGFGNNGPTGGSGAGFGSGGGGNGVGGGCAGVTSTAEKVPLDMFVMFDKSSSMTDPTANGMSKWNAAVSGMTTFVNQPASAGIGVGIQYFPQPGDQNCSVLQCSQDGDCGPGCGPCMGFGGLGVCSGFGNNDSCIAADYAMPAVSIGLLPGNAPALVASMNNEDPDGASTPTYAALDGAIQHATTWAGDNPGHVVVVVLVTDGDPTGCNPDISAIAALAASGANATPSVRTFVIGVGGSVSNLNAIASAGGTTDAFMIDSEPNVQQALIDALEEIQGAALPCSYLIPQPPNGEMINFGQINVSYTPGGGSPETIPKVDGPGSCPPDGLAWYYDEPNAPTQIMLCPNACTVLSQDTEGSVEIVVGCDTVVQ
jgi:hypothetical protein